MRPGSLTSYTSPGTMSPDETYRPTVPKLVSKRPRAVIKSHRIHCEELGHRIQTEISRVGVSLSSGPKIELTLEIALGQLITKKNLQHESRLE